MYIWGIFLLLGCLAKSSYACHQISYGDHENHWKDVCYEYFKGCEGYKSSPFDILNFVKGAIALLEKVGALDIAIKHTGDGHFTLRVTAELSVSGAGLSGGLLRVNAVLELILGIKDECLHYSALDDSLKSETTVLTSPVIDGKLIGGVPLLKDQIVSIFLNECIRAFTKKILDVVIDIIHAINQKHKDTKLSVYQWGEQCHHAVKKIEFHKDTCLVYFALVVDSTGELIYIADDSVIIINTVAGFLIGQEFISGIFGLYPIDYKAAILENYLQTALNIFPDITDRLTIGITKYSSPECSMSAKGIYIVLAVTVNIYDASGNVIVAIRVRVKLSVEISRKHGQFGVSILEVSIETSEITFVASNCGCGSNSELSEILHPLLEFHINALCLYFKCELRSFIPIDLPYLPSDCKCSPQDKQVSCSA